MSLKRKFLQGVCATATAGIALEKNDSGMKKKHACKKYDFVIIGGGTAGFSAFKLLKDAADRSNVGNILLLSNETHTPYMRPPLSKQLWDGQPKSHTGTFINFDGKKQSIFYKDHKFYEENLDAGIRTSVEVSLIDPVDNSIHLTSGECIKYNKCLLAPGGTPKTLDLFSSHPDQSIRERFSVFRSFNDFLSLKNTVQTCSSVAVVGGGYLGCELSIALANLNKKNPIDVLQIIPESGYMGLLLPTFLSEWVGKRVNTMGVKFEKNGRISCVDKSEIGDQVELTLSDGRKIKADHVIVAIGIEPDTRLASKSNLEIDLELGGIFANGELQSSVPDIWVAGDACSFYDTRMNCRRRVEHHDHAVVSGRLAAKNMLASHASEVGLNVDSNNFEAFYHQSMFWGDLGEDIGYEAIGLVDSKLPVKAYFKSKNGSFCVTSDSGDATSDDLELSKGVLFYLEPVNPASTNKSVGQSSKQRIVGVLCWNIFGKIANARGILGQEFLDSETDKLSISFL